MTKPEQKLPAGQIQGSWSKVTRPWEVVSIDLIGPLPRSKGGYSFILVVTDLFSKFCLTFPLRNAKTPAIVKHIEKSVILLFGAPNVIICDNGVQFRSNVFKNLMKNYDVTIRFTANYHPQANPVERVNRNIKTMLRGFVGKSQKDWDKVLPKITCALRTAVHSVTGHIPYFVNFGREMELEGQNPKENGGEIEIDRTEDLNKRCESLQKLREKVQGKISKAYESYKNQYNLRRRDVRYQVGDSVWKRNFVLSDATIGFSNKLAPKYIGPFRINKVIGYNVYELKDNNSSSVGRWHVKDLKPAYGKEIDNDGD